MSRKQHIVRLSVAQRAALTRQTTSGVGAARLLTRARILLLADAGVPGPRWTDRRIAAALGVSTRTVARVRSQYATDGLERALQRQRPRTTTPRRIDGELEARVVALACSSPPAGRARWSLRLLAHHLVALEIVPQICAETVRTTLKKTGSSRG